jgi:hypothetical protein
MPFQQSLLLNCSAELQMTQQYWYHVQCYPLNGSIRVKIAQRELLRQLSIMQLDVATSPTVSTSDFSEEQCERYQSMLRSKLYHGLFTRANMGTLRLSCQLQDMDGSSFDDANQYAAQQLPDVSTDPFKCTGSL